MLRRFTASKRLQKFDIKLGQWRRRGTTPPYIFSSLGYNQLVRFGELDDSLDREFQKIETNLPKTLAALDNAATKESTQLDPDIYENLCWYLAFLWNMCPFAKAVAPINFIHQIMLDLQNGQLHRLKALGHSDENIAAIQQFHNQGYKFIIGGNNYLQLVYRIVFNDKCRDTFCKFRFATKWTVYQSPIELPMSDVALVHFHDKNANELLHILPIAPTSVLIGTLKMGETPTSTDTFIKGAKLTDTSAEHVHDIICASAFFALASKSKIGDIASFRQRAIKKGIGFAKIHNLESVLTAGLVPFVSEKDFMIVPVKPDEYVKYTLSFITPYEGPHSI